MYLCFDGVKIHRIIKRSGKSFVTFSDCLRPEYSSMIEALWDNRFPLPSAGDTCDLCVEMFSTPVERYGHLYFRYSFLVIDYLPF